MRQGFYFKTKFFFIKLNKAFAFLKPRLFVCIKVISVDLTDSKMSPGGRGHQRLLTGLKSRLQLKTDFMLAHHPGECDAVHRWLMFPAAVV